MTRLTVLTLAACWAMTLASQTAQTPARVRRIDQTVETA